MAKEKAPAAEKVKKPIFKKWWFWLVVVCIIGILFAPKGGNETAAPAATAAPEAAPAIVLKDGEAGEFGTEVTLNAGTEFEEKEITYALPAGTYTIKNDDKAAVQVTVYSGGPEKNGEWEEFVADDNCSKPVVVAPGESGEIEIKDGQFITLSDGATNISFTAK